MNDNQKILLNLLQKALFKTSPSYFTEANWQEIRNEAECQAIWGLIASEIPEGTFDDLATVKYAFLSRFLRYCYAEEELKKVLDSASIPFVILKGNSAALYYDDPSLRAMGDIDFLVSLDDFTRVKTILVEAGFDELKENERHVEFKKDRYIFELHYHYSSDVNIEEYLSWGLKNRLIATIEEHDFPMLPALANGLVLLDHMRRHLKSGLGLRQVIDWMMFVNAQMDDEFWEKEFAPVACEKGMGKLAITATRMCQIYLGLPMSITWCQTADEKLCERLLECLLVSGNFGRKNGQGFLVEYIGMKINRKGLLRWLQYAGEHNWDAYHKHRWLKPFCWAYQVFRYINQAVKTGRSKAQIGNDLERSKQRYELLKELEIE